MKMVSSVYSFLLRLRLHLLLLQLYVNPHLGRCTWGQEQECLDRISADIARDTANAGFEDLC